MEFLSIHYGGEFMRADAQGRVSRWVSCVNGYREVRGGHWSAYSDTWRIIGAVRLNNFGSIVEHFTLADIIAGRVTQWKHKNGKQRVFVIDLDHGTRRMWGNPSHEVYPVGV